MNGSILNAFAFLALAVALAGPSSAQEGFLDETFAGGNSYLTHRFDFVPGGSISDFARGIARASDGHLTVVGTFRRPSPANPFSSTNFDCGLMRLLPDGAGLDPTFAPPNGFRTLALDLGHDNLDYCDRVVVLGDGSTWIAGFSHTGQSASDATNIGFIVRLLPNGDVDSNFFADGVFLLNSDLPPGVGPNSFFHDLKVDASGRVLATGNVIQGTAPNTNTRGIVVRFLADGTLDPDFASGGYALLADFSPPQVFVNSLVQDSQGRLVVTGFTSGAFAGSTVGVVFRLLDSGAPDTGFGFGMTPSGGGGRGFVQRCSSLAAAHLDSANRLLASCVRFPPPAPAPFPPAQVIRLLANGLTDLNFGSAGVAPVTFEYDAGGAAVGLAPSIEQILSQGDNKILVTGSHEAAVASDWGTNDIGVLRLLPNGNADLSFGQNRGASLFRFPGRNQHQEYPSAALLEPNGRMVIVGSLSRAPVSGGSSLTDFLVMAVRTANVVQPDQIFADDFE